MSNGDKAAVVVLLIVATLVPVTVYDHLLGERLKSQPPRQLEPAELVKAYSILSYQSLNWEASTFLGIPTWQNPNDVWITQELISRIRPDFIVEAGTFHGGSALLWAMILQQVNPAGRVITIDIEDLVDEAKLPPISKHVDFLVGSSTAPEIVARVHKQVQGKQTLVILDSDHRKDHVLAELRAYSPLVQVGSYIVVQDTNVNGHPVYKEFGPGPMEALDEFLRENSDFAVDPTCERLLFTMHPRGYLRRLR